MSPEGFAQVAFIGFFAFRDSVNPCIRGEDVCIVCSEIMDYVVLQKPQVTVQDNNLPPPHTLISAKMTTTVKNTTTVNCGKRVHFVIPFQNSFGISFTNYNSRKKSR